MTRAGGNGGDPGDRDKRKRLHENAAHGKPGKKSQLTAEDRDLWQKIAQSVEPLHQIKLRVREGDRSGLDVAVSRTETGPPTHQTPKGPQQPLAAPEPFRRTAQTQKVPPPLAPFDRKRSRRIASGRIGIEARLDLHGARQAEAYGHFRAFILNCVARGLSTVLVVTGKGKTRPPDASNDDWDGYGSTYGADGQRGILRRSVPMWLEEPDLRLLVASYTAADIKHGGGGALYIHLRRRRDWRET